tara:strand:+ start:2468 stop:3295 length:828 start_codon:yes stop_codon:yes gene_type:complete
MVIKFIHKIKKNIAIINIMIFFAAALFFYLNKNKFDTYRTYIEYSFHERIIFNSPSNSHFFSSNKIQYFLNDLDFNKKLYGITDLGIENLPDEITINVDYNLNKIKFEFNTKRKKFNSIFISNNDEKDKVKKNEKVIHNFIEESLNKFHLKLAASLMNEIEYKEYQLNQLIKVQSNQIENRIGEIMLSDLLFDQKEYLAEQLRGLDMVNMHIIDKQNSISELNKFLELNSKWIIINDFSNKYRRLHLNSEEYVISFLILIFLFNFLIKNFDKILK